MLGHPAVGDPEQVHELDGRGAGRVGAGDDGVNDDQVACGDRVQDLEGRSALAPMDATNCLSPSRPGGTPGWCCT